MAAELSSGDRDMVCKAENVYYLVLYRISLLAPELDYE